MMLLLIMMVLAVPNQVMPSKGPDSKSTRTFSPSTSNIRLDKPNPLLLSFLNRLSNRENREALESNTRHQRQIRFKNSYQELPKSLINPTQRNKTNTTTPNLSYFIQVDLSDPPPSSALKVLPDSVKTYFPPEVSSLIKSIEKDQRQQKNREKSESRTLSPKTKDKTSTTSTPANVVTSSYETLGNNKTSLVVENSKPPLKSNNLTDSKTTVPRQGRVISTPQSSRNSGPQKSTTSNADTSSYLFYNSKSSVVSPGRISTSKPPSVNISVSQTKVEPGKNSFSRSNNFLSAFSKILSSPPVNKSSPITSSYVSTSPTTLSTKSPPRISGPNKPLGNHQNSQIFFTSLPKPSSFSKKKSNQGFIPIRNPKSHLVTTQRAHVNKPKPKLQTSFSQSLKVSTPQTPAASRLTASTFPFTSSYQTIQPTPQSNKPRQFSVSKPNTPRQSSVTIGKPRVSIQKTLSPPTKPYSPPTKTNSKSLLSNSMRVFQASKGSSGINSPTASRQSPRDGKTKTLNSSDHSNTMPTFPSRNSPSNGPNYPILKTIPKTGFQCASKTFGGYYADKETNCQVFHMCWGRRSASFLCPEGTLFNQKLLVCDWWYNVDCSSLVDGFTDSDNRFDFWDRNQV